MQFFTILICSKLFSIMTFIPDKNENGATFIITIVSASALMCLLLIPAVAFYKKNNGEGILSFAASKSRILAVVISVLYLIISIFAIIKVMGDLAFFLQYCFSDTYAPWAVIIILAGAAFYIAQLRLPTLARTTGIITIITLIGLTLVMLGFHHHIDFIELNLAVQNPVSKVLSGYPRVFSDTYELAAFVILMHYLKKRPAATIYSFLSIKAVIISLTILAVTLVLGNYALMTKIPFFALSAFSQTKIIEHFEAFFMLFWTLCAIIKITLFTLCADDCINQIFPKLSRSVGKAAALIIPAAVAIPLLINEKWEGIKYINLQAILIVTGVFAVPLIMLMFKKRKNQ